MKASKFTVTLFLAGLVFVSCFVLSSFAADFVQAGADTTESPRLSDATSLTAKQIIFENNFDDGVIDSSKWYLSCGGKRCVDGRPGKTVEEFDGILRVAADATDNRGVIISQPITIDTSKLITIERRIKVHYSNRYCKQSLSILD